MRAKLNPLTSALSLSDVDRGDILALIKRNLKHNEEVLSDDTDFKVFELDFFREDLPDGFDVADIILATDVVYDELITRAFFRTLCKLVKESKRKKAVQNLEILVAIERRGRAAIDQDGNGIVAAPNFDIFTGLLHEFRERISDSARIYNLELIPPNFPQRFNLYQRTSDLHLWRMEVTF